MMPKRITRADAIVGSGAAPRVVIVTMDSHLTSAAARAEAGLPETAFVTLGFGETQLFPL